MNLVKLIRNPLVQLFIMGIYTYFMILKSINEYINTKIVKKSYDLELFNSAVSELNKYYLEISILLVCVLILVFLADFIVNGRRSNEEFRSADLKGVIITSIISTILIFSTTYIVNESGQFIHNSSSMSSIFLSILYNFHEVINLMFKNIPFLIITFILYFIDAWYREIGSMVPTSYILAIILMTFTT